MTIYLRSTYPESKLRFAGTFRFQIINPSIARVNGGKVRQPLAHPLFCKLPRIPPQVLHRRTVIRILAKHRSQPLQCHATLFHRESIMQTRHPFWIFIKSIRGIEDPYSSFLRDADQTMNQEHWPNVAKVIRAQPHPAVIYPTDPIHPTSLHRICAVRQNASSAAWSEDRSVRSNRLIFRYCRSTGLRVPIQAPPVEG